MSICTATSKCFTNVDDTPNRQWCWGYPMATVASTYNGGVTFITTEKQPHTMHHTHCSMYCTSSPSDGDVRTKSWWSSSEALPGNDPGEVTATITLYLDLHSSLQHLSREIRKTNEKKTEKRSSCSKLSSTRDKTDPPMHQTKPATHSTSHIALSAAHVCLICKQRALLGGYRAKNTASSVSAQRPRLHCQPPPFLHLQLAHTHPHVHTLA